jgi:flagellar protein FliO/FliZ
MKFGILFTLLLISVGPVLAVSDMEAAEVAASAEKAEVSKTDSFEEKTINENQIPVNFTKVKKSEAAETSSGRLFLTFGIMAFILGIGYYLAKKYGRPKNSTQTKIKILSQHYLGPKKSLAIVRVAGESILIGVTDQNISMIKSLSLLDDEIPEGVTNATFQETLNEKKEMGTERRQFNVDNANKDQSEEFSIRHIKDVVSLKLKGMRGEN